jgi:hypothetical protein
MKMVIPTSSSGEFVLLASMFPSFPSFEKIYGTLGAGKLHTNISSKFFL